MAKSLEEAGFDPPCDVLDFATFSSKYGKIEIGILDTPCFPARFYVGLLREGCKPADNNTSNFHQDLDMAIESFSRHQRRLGAI